MLWWKVWNDQAIATQKWYFPFFFFLFFQSHYLVSSDLTGGGSLPRHQISEVCRLRFWEACSSPINFINSDEIIPWGFQENSWGKIFNKKVGIIWFHFGWWWWWWRGGGLGGGGFVKSGDILCNTTSSTFLCHADFIPDRSCLDVPVGRKCSACNGLAPIPPWTTVSLWSIFPLIYSQL